MRSACRAVRVVAVLLAAVLAAAGCGPATARERTLTVFAASSLTDVFGELTRRFEASHPGVAVRLNTAGSARLAQQITEGAPADVFASADRRTMREVAEAGLLAGDPETFATNTLAAAVAPGNPLDITGFADLAEGGVSVVVCAPSVPCGAATERVERRTGVRLRPVSEEGNVRSVLTKVEVGAVDAGVVYETDVTTSDEVERVGLPRARDVANTYPIAIPSGTAEPRLAREFRDLLLGDEGMRVLAEAGFGLP